MIRRAIAFLLAAVLCPVSSVSSDFVPPPYGWVDFCDRSPNICHARHKPELIALTPHRLAQIEAINYAVNKGTLYVTDLDHFGRIEHWTYPVDAMGDCEDYALEKQRRLARLFPRSALLIAFVLDREGQNHAVLVVMTDAGPFVLDNQTFAILRPEQTGHAFMTRQSRTQPNRWVFFGDTQ